MEHLGFLGTTGWLTIFIKLTYPPECSPPKTVLEPYCHPPVKHFSYLHKMENYNQYLVLIAIIHSKFFTEFWFTHGFCWHNILTTRDIIPVRNFKSSMRQRFQGTLSKIGCNPWVSIPFTRSHNMDTHLGVTLHFLSKITHLNQHVTSPIILAHILIHI